MHISIIICITTSAFIGVKNRKIDAELMWGDHKTIFVNGSLLFQ